MTPQQKQEVQDGIREYQDAVWAFIVEHCDITESGKFFVKFHADHRKNFENRVWGRYKYGYHREDWKAKQKRANTKKENHAENKRAKRGRYVRERAKRIAMRDWSKWYASTQEGGILRRWWGVLSAATWKRKPQN